MQIDHVAVTLLKEVATEPGLTVKGLCQRTGLPLRHFYYRWGKINDWLRQHHFSPLSKHPREGVMLAKGEAEAILNQLASLSGSGYKLQAGERRDHLLLSLLTSHLPQFTRHLCQLNRVSRNTTLADIQLLKQQLQAGHGITLIASKKCGYQLTGEVLALRLCVLQMLQRTLKYGDAQAEMRVSQLILTRLTEQGGCATTAPEAVDRAIAQAEQHLKRSFTDKDRRLLHKLLLFCLLPVQQEPLISFSDVQLSFLRSRPECEAAALVNALLAEQTGRKPAAGNTLFFTLLLSISKSLTRPPATGAVDCELVDNIHRLINDFQALSGFAFTDISQLVSRLFAHLGPALQRCLFHIPSENVLRREVMQHYPLIFRLCRQAIRTLESAYQVEFNDDELSYIAIGFAAWLDKRKETREQSLILVTEGGLSSTAMLENQLRNLTVVPLAIQHASVSQPGSFATGTRLIVSTVALPAEQFPGVTVIRVQHMLTAQEKSQIRQLLEGLNEVNTDDACVNRLLQAGSHQGVNTVIELQRSQLPGQS